MAIFFWKNYKECAQTLIFLNSSCSVVEFDDVIFQNQLILSVCNIPHKLFLIQQPLCRSLLKISTDWLDKSIVTQVVKGSLLHYHVHNRPQLDPILSHINPLHISFPYCYLTLIKSAKCQIFMFLFGCLLACLKFLFFRFSLSCNWKFYCLDILCSS